MINKEQSVANAWATNMSTVLAFLKPLQQMPSMTSMSAFSAFQKCLVFLDFLAADLTNIEALLDHYHLHHFLLSNVDKIEEVNHFYVPAHFSSIFLLSFSLKSNAF